MKKIYIVGIIVVGIIVVLDKIDNDIMPYYAMVRLTAHKDTPAMLAIFENGKVTHMSGVNGLYIGWNGLLSLWPLLASFVVVGSTVGCLAGLQIMKVIKDTEIKELKESIPILGMTISGITIRQAKLDKIEDALKKETHRLLKANEELKREKNNVDLDKANLAMLRAKLEEAHNQLPSLKKDQANRLDKIARLENTIEKLEAKNIDIERKLFECKKENLMLCKAALAMEESKIP